MSLPLVQRPLTAFVLGSLLGLLGVGFTFLKGSRAARGWCLIGLLARLVGLAGLGAVALIAWSQQRADTGRYDKACACGFDVPAGMSRVAHPDQPRRYELADREAGVYLVDTTVPLGEVFFLSPLSYAAQIGSADDEGPFHLSEIAGFPAAVRAWRGVVGGEEVGRLELVFATQGRVHHLLVWSTVARGKENKDAVLGLIGSFRADPEDPTIATSSSKERFANFYTRASLSPDTLRAELLDRPAAVLATEERRLETSGARLAELRASGASPEALKEAEREHGWREQQVAAVRDVVERGRATWDIMAEAVASKGAER